MKKQLWHSFRIEIGNKQSFSYSYEGKLQILFSEVKKRKEQYTLL